MQGVKSVNERVAEFVRYHALGDGECNNVVLKEFCEGEKLSLQERYELAVLFSITYCVESAIVLFRALKEGRIREYSNIKEHPEIIFQSDRKYMRMVDSFSKCMNGFLEHHRSVRGFLDAITVNGFIDLKTAVPYVSSWTMFGRFSAFLLLETFADITGMKVVNASIEWKKGDTATSGLLNVFGYDEAANLFDKKNKLLIKPKDMDRLLSKLLVAIETFGGETNVTMVETSLCAYRKFYKQTRYNGYYLDRMLSEIVYMRQWFPELSDQLSEIRKRKFDERFLGEIGGWSDIRRSLNHYYIENDEINDL